MDRLPRGGSWPFFGAHWLRDGAKTPAKRVALAGLTFSGPASSLLSGCHGFLGALAMVQVISELAQFYFNGTVAQFHNERRAFKF
jgi:hypothetical protein